MARGGVDYKSKEVGLRGGGGGGAPTAGGQAQRSENSLSWAGILRWDGGMSHMLSMSCLCVYQSGG